MGGGDVGAIGQIGDGAGRLEDSSLSTGGDSNPQWSDRGPSHRADGARGMFGSIAAPKTGVPAASV